MRSDISTCDSINKDSVGWQAKHPVPALCIVYHMLVFVRDVTLRLKVLPLLFLQPLVRALTLFTALNLNCEALRSLL